MRRWALPLVAVGLLAACYGNGGGGNPLDADAFSQASGLFGEMGEHGRAGDADGAEEAFLEVFPFTLAVDDALQGLPTEVIARAELIDAVTRIRGELEDRRRPDFLAGMAEDAQVALADAAEALGVERPAGP